MSAVGLVRRWASGAAVSVVAWAASSCSVGEGEGWVSSSRLLAPGCFSGPYDLKPTFFASNPHRQTQMIRVQRLDDLVENSDGLQVTVVDTARVRGLLGRPLKVGLPPEVTPPGVPVLPDADPPLVHVTLYLHDTCHGENLALYAVSGEIVFQQLFSGDPNEERAEDRLTEADLDVMVGDPRDQPPAGGAIPADRLSPVQGHFEFFFERGQPAQPFP